MAEMTAQDVLRLLDLFDEEGLTVWVDGGWGIDALLREQTRAHSDLDVVVSADELPALRRVLSAEGFEVIPRAYRSWNFVVADGKGREVDIHVVVFDERGDGIYGPLEAGEKYPAPALEGIGAISGREVRCITPEWQVRFHTGYEWDDSDHVDVRLLGERFGLEIPEDPTIPLWRA